MNKLSSFILSKIVQQPTVTIAELSSANGSNIESDVIFEILENYGINKNTSQEVLLFERWSWENIVFQQIYSYENQTGDEWFDETVELLKNNGLSQNGASEWLREYLRQINIVSEMGEGKERTSFEHDLKVLNQIATDKNQEISYSVNDFRIIARYITRQGLYLVAGYSPEVVRDWTATRTSKIDSRDTLDRAAAWITFAIGFAYPSINSNERLVSGIFDTARNYVKDFGFDKLENTDLFFHWFESNTQKEDLSLNKLRGVCPKLLPLGENYLRDNADRWKNQWFTICIQRPNWHVKKSGIFSQEKSGTFFLEIFTEFSDRLDRKRVFSWRLLSVFWSVLLESQGRGEDGNPINSYRKEMLSQWKDTPTLTDAAISQFFRFHEYDDHRKVSILLKLLNCEVIDRSELNNKDRVWLLRQLFVHLILEAMLLDIRLDKGLYSKAKYQFIQNNTDLKLLFSGIAEYEVAKALEYAREVLGISEESPFPNGMRSWRSWHQHRQRKESLFTVNLRTFLLNKNDVRERHPSFTAPTSSRSTNYEDFRNRREEAINLVLNKTSIARTFLDEIDDAIKRLNSISIIAENDSDPDQLAQLKAAIAYWQSENNKLLSQFRDLKKEAVIEFLESWNGEKSKNSTLNQLFLASRSESSKTAELAQDILQKFRTAGVKAYKSELVGTIVELTDNNVNEWLLSPGTTLGRYNGQAYVLTPEWRYFDVVLEKSWVTLPNK